MRGLVHPRAAEILPRYPSERHSGMKKAWAPRILAHIPPWAHTLGDAFSGSGVVAWFAKLSGLRVLANEILAFGHLRLQALILNDGVVLEEEDIAFLGRPNPARLAVAVEWYGRALGTRNSSWVDNLAANIRLLDEPKRPVAAYTAVICLMKKMNYPHVSFTKDRRFTGVRYLDGFDWDREFRNHALHEFPDLLHANGLRHELCRMDAPAFSASRQCDVLYLDSPFTGTVDYSQDLAFYDKLVLILEGRQNEVTDPYSGPPPLPPHTRFTGRHSGLMGLDRIFLAAAHVPRIILSWNTTASIHPDELVQDGERIYGRLAAREEMPVRLPVRAAGRPRMTTDLLLVFDRKPSVTLHLPVTRGCETTPRAVTVNR